ncbi:SGNH/GDSL hydrolase family protein [Gordonia sp. SL306]|uniref:SGNH/GDSL hydrolase family protein n=1 Tax=Gordonia sp. SL306 TaxID=2995145 RepID=UPI00226D8EDD|nr:SGNH/GDSL hydrolase family protein [Gordonia sp. SL306]WAC57793.1 SGNH/GDSL hydrolase family protein [Gordonia sp. SL306]
MHVTRAFVTRAATVAASLVTVAIVAAGMAVVELSSPDVEASAARAERPASAGRPAVRYVALGSSYAAGPGATRLVDRRCLRTADNYPHQVAAARGLSLTDVTCSGATTANILRTPQSPYADVPQITAVTPDTDLVTVTIGGNDLSYISRVAAQGCANTVANLARDSVISGCRAGARVRPEPSADAYTAVEHAIVEIVSQVRSHAPHAKVVIVDYPPLIDPHAPQCSRIPLTADEAAETVRVHDGLVAATARAARISGAALVTASKTGAAHTACSSQPWLSGFEPPAPYHPTELGKSGVAQLVLRVLNRAG